MRKFILVLILFLFTAFPVSADTISGLPSGADVFISQTITLTDNAAAVDFSTMLGGGYLFAVERLFTYYIYITYVFKPLDCATLLP